MAAKKSDDKFINNLDKWVNFISWARWNPDLFLDLITPETGGIRLDLDQRVFLRSLLTEQGRTLKIRRNQRS